MEKREYPALGVTLYTSRLPSGLSLYVVPRPGWRRCVGALVTSFGGADRRFSLDGAAFDVPAGTAHYLEHKLFDMPEGSVDDIFAARGAGANAYTSEAVTSYHFTCTDRFEENLRTLLKFVSTACFTAETVEKERGIIGQEIAEFEDDPAEAAYMGCMGALFGAHPLADMVVGTRPSVAGITPETLYACHKAFYVPANMALCAAGDIDPAAVERMAAEVLPAESGPAPVRDYGPAPGPEPAEKRAERTMDVSAPLFCAGAKLGPVVTGPEALKDRLTAELAFRCLWGGSAPAYLELYEKGLLNDGFRYEPIYAAGMGALCLEGESKDPDAALAVLLAAAEKAAREGLDPAFFHRQKKALLGGLIRLPDDFWELTASLAEGCFGGFSPLDAAEVLTSVGPEDAAAWIREHLAPEHFAISIIRPKEEQE